MTLFSSHIHSISWTCDFSSPPASPTCGVSFLLIFSIAKFVRTVGPLTADMLSLHLDSHMEKLRPRTNKNIFFFFFWKCSREGSRQSQTGKARGKPAVSSTRGDFTREHQFKLNSVSHREAENRDQEFSVVSHFSNPIVLPQPLVTPTSY